MEFAFILAIGLVAGTLSGIVGFGSSIMLMPVLVIVFGPLRAVPIMAMKNTPSAASMTRVGSTSSVAAPSAPNGTAVAE